MVILLTRTARNKIHRFDGTRLDPCEKKGQIRKHMFETKWMFTLKHDTMVKTSKKTECSHELEKSYVVFFFVWSHTVRRDRRVKDAGVARFLRPLLFQRQVWLTRLR